MSRVKTPIAFLIFRRPNVTRRVFEMIRKAQPSMLFVIADGPSDKRSGEEILCEETRKIIDSVDWDCKVFKRFSKENIGLRRNVSEGLSWVFDQCESAIIIEDDCLPHLSFFQYCDELLEKYRKDSRVMAICGNNFQDGITRSPYSYYFSNYFHCWGWATWKRAWKYYDSNMDLWPEVSKTGLLRYRFNKKSEYNFWKKAFEDFFQQQGNSWSFVWTMSIWQQGCLSIIPSKNLITNIGFDESATNTCTANKFENMESFQMESPLNHPSYVLANLEADSYVSLNNFNIRPRWIRALRRILNKQ